MKKHSVGHVDELIGNGNESGGIRTRRFGEAPATSANGRKQMKKD